jgi:hypothetical protein
LRFVIYTLFKIFGSVDFRKKPLSLSFKGKGEFYGKRWNVGEKHNSKRK